MLHNVPVSDRTWYIVYNIYGTVECHSLQIWYQGEMGDKEQHVIDNMIWNFITLHTQHNIIIWFYVFIDSGCSTLWPNFSSSAL